MSLRDYLPEQAPEDPVELAAFLVVLPLCVPVWLGMTVAVVVTAPAAAAFADQLDAAEAVGIPTARTVRDRAAA